MITINAAFGQEEKVLGTLGRIGENETRQIVFDCSDILTEYPGAEIVCVMQRHCDRIAYLADAVLDGNALTVTLTDADVSAPGDLRIELRALTDGKIRKSAVYMGQVVSALRGEQDRPGNPTADVLNRIDMTISRAEKSIAEADAAAKSAQTVADIVQAKLDNGDFVGPAGKPGSDASVTADNIQAALGYTPVKDVQLNGESLVQDSMATIPLVGYNRLGAVQLDPAGFAAASVEGKLALVPPTDAQISTHTYTQRPITPSCMDYAVTAAMTDGKGPAWTAAQQAAARDRMGIDKAYELIETITTDGTAIVERAQEPDGTPYNFVAIKVVITSPKALSDIKTIYARIFCGQRSNATYSSFKANSNYFLRATYTWEKKHNIVTGIVNETTYIYTAQDLDGGDFASSRITPDVIVADGNFAKLQVYSINNQPIHAGFLIQIYGVRA